MTQVLDEVRALRLRANRSWRKIQAAVAFQSYRHSLHNADDFQFLRRTERKHTPSTERAQTLSPLPTLRSYLCAFGSIHPESDVEALPGTLFGRSGSDRDDLVTPGWDQAAARHHRQGFSQVAVHTTVQAESERKVPTVMDDGSAVGQNTEGWKHLGRENHCNASSGTMHSQCFAANLKFYRANTKIHKQFEGKIQRMGKLKRLDLF